MATSVGAQTLPPDFEDALVMGGFVEPVGATWDNEGRTYVWEKRGVVWIIENGEALPQPLIDLREEVGNWRDHGMLGFALDPHFHMNGRIYLMYAVDRHHLMHFGTPQYDPNANDYYNATIIRITRYTALAPSFNTVDPASRLVLLGETPQTGAVVLHESHSAGSLFFGTDGTLLASLGDGASYTSVDVGNAADSYHEQALADGMMRPEENVGALRAQMVNSHSGKVVRLDPNTGDGVPSNPWFDPGAPRAPRSRVWAMGVRNTYRFTIRPGSGSTDPAAGDPGTLYMGDVGWNLWEELNVADEGGMNFGWPLFEGFEVNTYYWNVPVANRDAPNPLYNGAYCDQQFFTFQSLIKQATPDHLNAHPNPCDASVQIPNTIPKHFHARPAIDWRHGNQSRCGGFVGNTPVVYNLTDPNSPVPGPNFGGFAAIAGPWVEGSELPAGYQGASFHADYAMGFIRRFMFNEQDEPQSVHDFASGLGAITWLGAGPDGCIWYVKYNTNELRRICFTLAVDLPPMAVAEQSVQYGPGPLTVQFTGSNSSDPGGGALTYHWDFGDGDTSDQADPQHTFTAPAGVVTTYTVVLTVTDTAGQSATATLIVSLNNTPPVVDITSFEDGSFYPVGVDTIFSLEADVSDAEHGPDDLSYAWRTTLHHNTHTHPEPIDTDPVTTTLISGVGCDGETYYYNIRLTVTDAGGLASTVEQHIYPACHLIAPTAVIIAEPSWGFAPLTVQFDGSGSYDPGEVVAYHWDFGDGTTSNEPAPEKVFANAGPNYVTLTVTDDDGLTGVATRIINVLTLDPPPCAGDLGGLLREEWNNVNGGSVADLLGHGSYPDSPDATSIITSSSAPSVMENNFGARVRGHIVPEQSGTYIFTLTSDDASVAYLSPNADPAFKQVLANVPGFTGPNEYDKYASQVSTPVQLQAGVYYYVELLHKQWFGEDHLALRWHLQGADTPQVIPGSQLAPFMECSPGVQVRMLLQGAWSGQGMMRDDLRTAGVLPLEEPYTAMGLSVDEPVPADASLLLTTGSNAVVDWVLLELRDAVDPSTVLTRKAALLQRDGDVVAPDGFHRILFDVAPGAYHLAIRHRNHLGAMTALPVSLGSEGTVVDLTTSGTGTWGEHAQVMLAPNKWALWMGNVLHDDAVRYAGAANDRDPILQQIGTIPTDVVDGYHQADVNMDGLVKYVGQGNDRDPILINVGGMTPTAIRQEQLP